MCYIVCGIVCDIGVTHYIFTCVHTMSHMTYNCYVMCDTVCMSHMTYSYVYVTHDIVCDLVCDILHSVWHTTHDVQLSVWHTTHDIQLLCHVWHSVYATHYIFICVCHTSRPTQSIIDVYLVVNRFQKSTLLIVQYKYLKSCSEDFVLQHPILRTKLCGTGFITHPIWLLQFHPTKMVGWKCFVPLSYQLPRGIWGGLALKQFYMIHRVGRTQCVTYYVTHDIVCDIVCDILHM